MQRNNKDPHRGRIASNKRSVSIEYGYILDMAVTESSSYYVALVAQENSILPADEGASPLLIAQTMEEITALYGSPEDLVGRRVRIEYFGSDWRTGVAYIAAGRTAAPVGLSMEIPSRGFRHAIAGGGSN